MAKRLICIIISVLMVASLLPTSAFAATYYMDSGISVIVADELEKEEPELDYGIAVIDEDASSTAVAKVGDNSYISLSAAISAASPGDTITLLANVSESSVTVSKNLTIDLSGYTLTTSYVYVDTSGVEVTVKNGTITGKYGAYVTAGTLTLDSCTLSLTDAAYAYGGELKLVSTTLTSTTTNRAINCYDSSTVTIGAGSTVNCENGTGVVIWGDGSGESAKTPTLNVYGNINAIACISGNGTDYSGTKINLYSGAVLTASQLGMYLPQPCTVNITGATVTGVYGAIGMKSGTLTISGSALIQGTGSYDADLTSTTNGINVDGSAIIIDSYSGYAGNVTVTIQADESGNTPTITSTNAVAVREISNSESTNVVSISISAGTVTSGDGLDAISVTAAAKDYVSVTGGTFSSDVSEYVSENSGKTVVQSSDGSTTVVTAVDNAVALVGSTLYTSLSNAIGAATSGDTVTLVDDATVTDLIEIKSSQNITLDLVSYTVSGEMSSRMFAVSGTLTITASSGGKITNTGSSNAISNGNTLIINGGEITASSAYAVYNTGTLTVNGGTLTGGTSGTGYAIYNAGGTVTIGGGAFTSTNSEVGAIRNNATLVINDGAVGKATDDVYGVYNAGTVTVYGGTLTGSTAGLINTTSDSSVTVYDGTFGGNSSKRGLYNSTGTATIYGGTFTGTEYGLMTNSPEDNTTTVYAGTFHGDIRAIIGYISSTIATGSAFASGSYDQTDCVVMVCVAKIGNTYYKTLNAAINAASSGATITLLTDVTEDVVIASGKSVIIDLAGNTITNSSSHTIVNYGTLIIQDSSEDNSGVVDCVTHGKGALVNYGTATLLGGTYERSAEAGVSSSDNGGNSWYTLKNYGTLTVGVAPADNGTTTTCSVVVTNSGSYSSCVANGYQNTSDKTSAQAITGTDVVPTMYIYGGTFSGGIATIKNDDNATLSITDGSFSNSYQDVIQNHSTVAISGGTFTATGTADVIYNCGCDSDIDKGVLTITGGTFTASEDYPYVIVEVSTASTATVAITDGTFTGTVWVWGSSAATMAIAGGTYSEAVNAEYCAVGFTPTSDETTYGVYQTYVGISTADTTYPATIISTNGSTSMVVKASSGNFSQSAYPTYTGYVFAGWYTDATCTTACDSSMWTSDSAAYYAKFVDANVLTVACYFTPYEEKNALRFFTSWVDIYPDAGFDLYIGDTLVENAISSIAYYTESYTVGAVGNKTEFKPSSFSSASVYLVTGRYYDTTKATSFAVVPYWVTCDGTKVCGTKVQYDCTNVTSAGVLSSSTQASN